MRCKARRWGAQDWDLSACSFTDKFLQRQTSRSLICSCPYCPTISVCFQPSSLSQFLSFTINILPFKIWTWGWSPDNTKNSAFLWGTKYSFPTCHITYSHGAILEVWSWICLVFKLILIDHRFWTALLGYSMDSSSELCSLNPSQSGLSNISPLLLDNNSLKASPVISIL